MKFNDAQDLLQPDIHSSSKEYAERFSGPVGKWFLDVQKNLTESLLKDTAELSIVDFGGGHGQNCWLAEKANSFTVHASASECFANIESNQTAIKQAVGGLLDSGFEAGAYDIAMSYRMLAHLDDWQAHITELCRVSKRAVIIEFPSSNSVNVVAGNFFSLKKSVEGNTRQFGLFQLDEIETKFANNGFELTQHNGQYLLPMALHRALKFVGLSRALESVASVLLSKKRFGSPLICRFDRRPQ